MSTALISVIIPNYNRAHLIGETLDSVRAQTYTNWECIIVDDGSTDNSEEVIVKYIKKDNRIQFQKRPAKKLKGPSGCRNFGIKKSMGDYVIFLDSDDILEPFCFKQRIDFVNKNDKSDFWIFKMNILSEGKKTQNLYNTIPFTESEEIFYKKEFLKGNFPFTVTCPFWRAVILKENEFDEKMIRLEDPDLHIRVLQKGYKCITAKDLPADTYYRVHRNKTEQLNSIKEEIITSNIYFLNKHYERINKDIEFYFDRVFRGLVVPYGSIKLYLKAVRVIKKHKILSFKKVIISFLMLLYNRFGLNNVKGLGYSKLNSAFKK